jgi:hypothetical protein
MSDSFSLKNAVFSIVVALIAAGGALVGAYISGESQIRAMQEAAIENHQNTLKLIEANLQIAMITAGNNLEATRLTQNGNLKGIELSQELREKAELEQQTRKSKQDQEVAARVIENDIKIRIMSLIAAIKLFQDFNKSFPEFANIGDVIVSEVFNLNRIMVFKAYDHKYIATYIERLPSECMFDVQLFYRFIQTVESSFERLVSTRPNQALFEWEGRVLGAIREIRQKNQHEIHDIKSALELMESIKKVNHRMTIEGVRSSLLTCLQIGYQALASVYSHALNDKKQANHSRIQMENVISDVDSMNRNNAELKKEFFGTFSKLSEFYSKYKHSSLSVVDDLPPVSEK